MKKIAKILVGTAMLAALVLTGCQKNVNDKDKDVKAINGNVKKAYLGEKDGDGFTNPSKDEYFREMKLFGTKHYGAFAALQLVGEENPSKNNGVLGYVVNYTENEDKTVNFMTIGYRLYDNKFQSYISQYYNISIDAFSEDNFGAIKKDSDGKPIKASNGKKYS